MKKVNNARNLRLVCLSEDNEHIFKQVLMDEENCHYSFQNQDENSAVLFTDKRILILHKREIVVGLQERTTRIELSSLPYSKIQVFRVDATEGSSQVFVLWLNAIDEEVKLEFTKDVDSLPTYKLISSFILQ